MSKAHYTVLIRIDFFTTLKLICTLLLELDANDLRLTRFLEIMGLEVIDTTLTITLDSFFRVS